MDRMTKLVFVLMTIIGGIGFWLSYDALMSLAHGHGKPGALGAAWPLIIDLPIIAFSLAGVIAARRNVSALPPRVVVGLATLATLAYNWYHAYNAARDIWYNVIAVSVAVAAPVMYFASFEISLWLIGVLRDSAAPQAVTEPAQAVTEPAQVVKPVTTVTATDDKPVTKPAPVVTKLPDLSHLDKAGRLAVLPDYRHLSDDDKAEIFGVSARTIKRDVKALNGAMR